MLKGIGKTDIEWCDLRWNPITGCDNTHCACRATCYARKIATRFAGTPSFPNGFKPTFHPDRIKSPYYLRKKEQKIFTCSMGELYEDGCESWTHEVLKTIKGCEKQTFITLTKRARNLWQWSPFPENMWVGVSATCESEVVDACRDLAGIVAKVKFLSIEPLLKWDKHKHMDWFTVALALGNISWVIIGAQTNPYRPPKKEHVIEIFHAVDGDKIPIFLKNNLKPLLATEQLRQEWPQ